MSELAPVLNSGAPGFLRAAHESGIELLDMRLEHAAATAALPLRHRDAFDGTIVGQAVAGSDGPRTGDLLLRRYEGVRLLDA